MNNNKASIVFLSSVMALGFGSACAHVAPNELVEARAAYLRASTGPARELTPSDVHKAKVSLDQAEAAFRDDSEAQATKDLAYVAQRRAQLAEMLAVTAQDNLDKAKAEKALATKKEQQARMTKEELAAAKVQIAEGTRQAEQTTDQLNAERLARQEAEGKTAEANAKNAALQASLANLAAMKEEQRGMVLTLSGGVLFVSNGSTLLPTAQTKLNQIAEALIAGGERPLTVEGFTDAQGGDSHNLDLSQRRAEAVRAYLVSRGYPMEKVKATGYGKARPIASNNTPEGRANNRRVEIVVAPKS